MEEKMRIRGVMQSTFAETGLGLINGCDSSHLNRCNFPSGFLFGAGSSAYQYEGSAFEGGKGPSIWDTFTHKYPVSDGSYGDVAIDFYNLYKDDVKLMKHIGLDAFRISISWPRILPHGKLSGGVNKEGITFYNNVFNELIANGITPFVTLFHWDLPQELEDEYNGFLSPLIIDDFRNFAELCFEEFGDRIKHWITVNEPYIFIICGYDGGFAGNFAPGRCSSPDNCVQGDSATEPYIAAHHMLICHASTIKLYKEKYQETQKGEIGITQVSNWMVPHSSTKLDIEAAQRALDFMYGWFIHPVVYGDYPEIMKSLIGNRLPKFTKEESSLLKGSFDFLGVNYYTATYASHISSPNSNITSTTDNMVHFSSDIEGVPIGDPTGVNGFYVYPEGLYELLIYTKENYNNPTIYITETGIGDQNNGDVENGIKDVQRIDFYNRHIRGVLQAIQQGVNVKGFFAWSFLDNFEWVSGYTIRFGLCYVDHENGLKRIPKQSALWFKNWLTMK
ncbi:PREDICTED: beta-glucosidase 13-like [Erythranthe guttata]|nr:PREDICTED: beta-glucosidase 13-like [Erythranthe guttata]|eukprot:XP_012831331.1 PREDICTED: beta-glucosidase 13-like [Erythranthe guttata]